jgi:hypothetical protein
MGRYTVLIALAAMIFLALAESSAQAQGFGRRGRLGPRVFAGANDFSQTTLFDLYRTGQIPIPPYFSLHPPVYYGERVRMPYGSSPFAYPYTWWQQYGFSAPVASPYDMASQPEPVRPRPRVIVNPYVNNAQTTSTSAYAKATRNPYATSY